MEPLAPHISRLRKLLSWAKVLFRRRQRLLPLAVVLSLVVQFMPLGLPAPSRVVNRLLETSAALGHRLSILPAWMNPDPKAITQALAPVDRLVAGLSPGIAYAQGVTTTLQLAKTCEPNPVNQGGVITYSLYITNTGSHTATILITDTFPVETDWHANLVGVPPSVNGGADWGSMAFPDDHYILIFTGDYFGIPGAKGLPPGNTAIQRFQVRVSAPFTDQASITNTTILTANIASALTTLCGNTVNAPRFEIAKTPHSPIVDAGGPLTHTLYITNAGHLTATLPFTVTDRIPDNTYYVTSSLPSTYSAASRTITWTLDSDLGINQGITTTFVVTVATPYTNGWTITNATYRAWSSQVITVAEGDPVPVTVRSSPALTLTKAADPDPVQAGGYLTYTLTLTNQPSANGHAQNVVVTDTVPISTRLQSYSAAVGGTDITSDGVVPGSVVTWTLPAGYELQVGESTLFTFTVRVHSPEITGTLITNAPYGVSATNATAATAGQPLTTTINSNPSLTLTKSVDPRSVLAGGFVTYTIAITNQGNETATGVAITDTLPVSFTFGSMVQGPAPNGTPTGVVTWTNQTVTGTVVNRAITPGPLTLVFTATTDAAIVDNSVFSNVVTATYGLGTISIGPTAPVTVTKPQLTIAKVGHSTVVSAGEALTYTITYSNSSSTLAHSVVITDRLPDHVTFFTTTGDLISYQPATPLAGQVMTYTVGNLAQVDGLQTITLAVAVTTPLTNSTVLTNEAWIGAAEPAVGGTGPVTTTVQSAPYIVLDKSANDPLVSPGDTLTYTLEAVNTGNANATGVIITDVLPIHTYFVTATGTFTPTSPAAGDVVTWTLGSLQGESLQTLTATLVVTIETPLTNGLKIANTAWITSAEGALSDDTVTVTVGSVPTLTLTKADFPDPVDAGATLLYTITVVNDASAFGPATGVVITDVVPDNTTFVTATQNGFSGPVGGIITWTLGSSLAPGNSAIVTFTVDVDSPLADGTTLTNTAWVTSAEQVGDTDTETTAVNSSPNLTLTKVADSGTVDAGDRLTYTIAVTNQLSANAIATGVFFTDVVPANTTFVTATTSGLTFEGPDASEVMTWTLSSSLAPSNDAVITFTVDVNSPLANGTILTNTAWVTCAQGDMAADTVTVTVQSAPQIVLDKSAGESTVNPGDTLTYTLEATNTGNGNATGVVITDVLPTHTYFVTATGGTFEPTSPAAGDVMTWTLGSLQGESLQTLTATLVVTIETPLTNGLKIANTAWITSTESSSNDDTVTVTVSSLPDLELVKTADPTAVSAGSTLTYTIIVTNQLSANATATGVVITDVVPDNTVFVTATTSGLTFEGPDLNDVITWTLSSSLAPGSDAVVTFTVKVDSPLANGTILTNTAWVTCAQQVPADDTVTTTVYAPDLAVVKSASPATFVRPNETITYVVVFSNTGPIAASDVRVTDTLPLSVSLVTSETVGAGFVAGSTYAWLSATVGSGDMGVITITAQVTTTPGWINTDGSTALVNDVEVSATGDGNPANDQDDATTPVRAGLPYTLSLTVAPTTTTVDDAATITATVTDQWGNPVTDADNITVTLETSLGQVSQITLTMTGGQQTTTIASTATGTAFITGSVGAYPTVTGTAQVTFTAGALHHFTFDPIGDQTAGVNFAITITAYDQYTNVVDYNAVVTLQDDGSASLQPTTSGNFVNGVLASQVVSITTSRVNEPIRAITTTTTPPAVSSPSNPFTVTASTPTTVTLIADPDTVGVGVNTNLTATVVDLYSNPTPSEVITFESINLGSGGVVPATDTTDTGGQATSAISSTLLGVRPVTATLVSDPSISATTQVTFTAGPPAIITLTIVPSTTQVGTSAQMTATVEDAYGNAVSGQSVTFGTSDALGSGGIASPATTDGSGIATSTISSTLNGVKTVEAQAASVTRTAQVTFTAGALHHFVIGPIPDPQTAGVAFTLIITAQDQYNNTADFAGTVDVADATGTVQPTVSGNFVSGMRSESVSITLAQANVTVVVTNTAGSESGTSNAFTVIAGAPATISLQTDPVDIPLQGTGLLTATATDAWSNLVADATVVTFTAAAGTTDPLTDTTVNGQATSQLTADCVERIGVAVTVTAGMAFTSTTVNFAAPGAPQSINTSAAPTSIVVGTGTAVVTATVYDCRPGAVPNQAVNLATSLGSLPAGGTTDVNGVVTATLSAGTVAGTAHITAAADGLSDSTTVTIEPGPPFTVTVTANPTSIPANGSSTSTIEVDVTDQYGNPVADDTAIALDYSPTTMGSLAPVNITTTAGSGSAVFTAGSLTGTVRITATAGGRVGTTLLTLTEGIRYVYLPMVARNYTPPPPYDLVVESVSWIPSPPTEGESYHVQVVVRNDGTMTVTTDFWVDLYLRPSATPGVNQTWNMLSLAGYGKAWLVLDDVGPGQTVTLLTSDPDDPENPSDRYSHWPPPAFDTSHNPFYVLVDSWGYDYGSVDEGTAEDNNLWGPANASGLGSLKADEMRRSPGPPAPPSGPRPTLPLEEGWGPRSVWWG